MSLPVADAWFRTRREAPDLWVIDEPHLHSVMRANIHLLIGRDADLLVDSGMGVAPLRPVIDGLRDVGKPLVHVCSHAHLDHVGGSGEFASRLIHAAEAEALERPGPTSLTRDGLSADLLKLLDDAGYPPLPPLLIDALPVAGFDVAGWRLTGCAPTGTLAEGDVVDLGDRRFAVLHLPGHSPGGIGLWDEADGTLFAGDAIYDGPLLAQDLGAYGATLRRLRDLPARVVHAGHAGSFGRARLAAICEDYLRRWGL